MRKPYLLFPPSTNVEPQYFWHFLLFLVFAYFFLRTFHWAKKNWPETSDIVKVAKVYTGKTHGTCDVIKSRVRGLEDLDIWNATSLGEMFLQIRQLFLRWLSSFSRAAWRINSVKNVMGSLQLLASDRLFKKYVRCQ